MADGGVDAAQAQLLMQQQEQEEREEREHLARVINSFKFYK